MIIYKTTNLINGKIYIGKASGKRARKIWYLGSGKWIRRAVVKHGRENFRRVTIDVAESKLDQSRKEVFWIDFYDARNPKVGYNFGPGGEGNGGIWLGRHHTEESKLKISKARKGMKFSEEHKQNMRMVLRGKSWCLEDGKRVWHLDKVAKYILRSDVSNVKNMEGR